MIRRTLARAVSAKTGVPAKTASQILDVALDVLLDDLVKTGRLEWRGLGTFTVRTYPARRIHNPATGKVIKMPARKSVAYKPSRRVRSRLATPTPRRSRGPGPR